ncbi:MAG: cytochrome c maturation protein CcmE [Flavobacteriales bacterium]|nr:cytochrome c maturation protein CcmE [Flavobacteriales bacterium]MCB9448914.1 cytochrome c maturation protein CcmE [Flavobacteriales bacterium]
MKKTHIIGIIVIALAIAAILSTMVDAGTYVNFGVAKEHPGTNFHVVGVLNKEKELIYEPEVDPNLFSFYLVDKEGKECKVNFNGAKPQDFERSEQVVIIGKMNGEEFSASKILMKCPSKYNNGKPGEMQEFTAAGESI